MVTNRRWILLGSLILIFIFWVLLCRNNFFHWDEWSFLMSFQEPLGTFLTRPYGEHYLPLNLINHFILFKVFGLNNFPFELMVISFHVFNCFLLYKIIYKETGSFPLSLLGLFLFGISNVYNEDVVWSQGISTVGSATLISLAFLSWLNFEEHRHKFWLILSLISLILSPLYNAFGTLGSFAFSFIVLLRRKSSNISLMPVILYFLVGIINLVILFHFSGSAIGQSTNHKSISYIYLIPEFIAYGIIRGNVIRFLDPGLHLLNINSQIKNTIYFVTTSILIGLGAYIGIAWLKERKPRSHRLNKTLTYLSLILVGYTAAALGRVSYGLSQAGIARYSYQSFFFLIVLGMTILKDFPKQIKITVIILAVGWLINLSALIKFQTSFWQIMVNRDKQFVTDVSYLFKHNQIVYDLPAKGIYPTITLSKLWFLYPKNLNIVFFSGSSLPRDISKLNIDPESKAIYQRILGDYQKKFD